MEHGALTILLLAIFRLAGFCARAALAIWLAGLVAGMAALTARHALLAWRRRGSKPRHRPGAGLQRRKKAAARAPATRSGGAQEWN